VACVPRECDGTLPLWMLQTMTACATGMTADGLQLDSRHQVKQAVGAAVVLSLPPLPPLLLPLLLCCRCCPALLLLLLMPPPLPLLLPHSC
jgi:hypothetical protein